ncbi:iron-containing redox enzyme family protein [Nocardia sp. SYP-A9097]|uniref:iron-containing redox enzyme family protein n=1 Tax=Nocardia sp. SYP-A9097 TaxID=2663237 RepID=UPI00129BCDE1|nr:iron-containing redox enzyme family protein [Nocardia sp. SYP-A9097]MRH90694.1 iron-containing redox enzyme family protein [Nocardia sp. SYP-A9097]
MTMEVTASTVYSLPSARGELSSAVVDLLRGEAASTRRTVGEAVWIADAAQPYGEDLQLALHICYELHYQGFESVDPEWEWDRELLHLRANLEHRFLSALQRDVAGGSDLEDELARLLVEPAQGTGIGSYLAKKGEWWQLREYFVHRSIYHHKEADSHVWLIPRLRGQAKASLVAIEFDEFGGGRGERMRSQLFAELLTGAELAPGYLRYLDVVPAPMLALVNMMSLFGMHRVWRGALVGQLTAAEITSVSTARRMTAALRRLAADPACLRFYAEHVQADAVHEQFMRHSVIGYLLAREPEQIASVVFGIQATNWLEQRFTEHLLDRSWGAGRSSLLNPPDGKSR